jgi:GMP synthase (glutamine-hydrolysing)
LRFLIVDGHSSRSRKRLNAVGMTLASELHARMLQRFEPTAAIDVIYPADADVRMPTPADLGACSGILWTGCDKSLADTDDPDLEKQLGLARGILQAETPCWGTCWGLQIMAVAAGGEVGRNPSGREIGLARKVRLTPEGRSHPMYAGKTEVFDALASHSDAVTRVPPGALVLAHNDHTQVQAMAFRYGKGTFWGVQYHPDYNTREVARLMITRKEILISEGFFKSGQDFDAHMEHLESLAEYPENRSLRWQLGIDDDILSADVRQREFGNWLKEVVARKMSAS